LVFAIALGPLLHNWGMLWSQKYEGAIFLSMVAGGIAFASLFAEGTLRRRRLISRFVYAVFAGGLAMTLSMVALSAYAMALPYLGTEATRGIREDTSLLTLRYSFAPWLFAGFSSGVGAWVARAVKELIGARISVDINALQAKGGKLKGMSLPGADKEGVLNFVLENVRRLIKDLFRHLAGGAIGGAFGAAVWHSFNTYAILGSNLYLGSAFGCWIWGGMHGLLVWEIPENLYTGWIRVLSADRYGLRIPINAAGSRHSERFVGHFPRGLDLYLGEDRGVAELHASFVVDGDANYGVRGLSIRPLIVKRFLEKIDLSYDAQRPAPFETDLRMEDRIQLGEGDDASEVEFLLLPKEEM
jgi:hypothetical protein